MGALREEEVTPRQTPRIRKDILEKAEAYRITHMRFKQLEKELKKLREEIEPYMTEKGVTELIGDEGILVSLEQRKMPPITARFTSYDVDDLLMVLEPAVAADCIVEVVDRELVEAYTKLGRIPQEIEELKKYNLTQCFVVK